MKIKGTVIAVTKELQSEGEEGQGEMRSGFLVKFKDELTGQEKQQWFNIYGTEEALNTARENLTVKGSVIEFENQLGKATEIKVLKQAEKSEENGFADDIIPFEEIMDMAHQKAEKDEENFSIETEIVNIDIANKTAIFKAKITVSDGSLQRVYEAHGDAIVSTNPKDGNISGDFVKPHFIRMAETRAIARALRWYTNNNKCVDVETSEGELPEEKKAKKTKK